MMEHRVISNHLENKTIIINWNIPLVKNHYMEYLNMTCLDIALLAVVYMNIQEDVYHLHLRLSCKIPTIVSSVALHCIKVDDGGNPT